MTEAASLGAESGASRRVVRVLRDGYWERTEVVELADGSLRVRKSSKGSAPPGPWGVGALRREIAYLKTLPEAARAAFPPLLASWDDASAEPPRVGYEVPFFAEHVDGGQLARQGTLSQREIDELEDVLAQSVFEQVHVPVAAVGEPLSVHVVMAVEQALGSLETDPVLAPVIGAPELRFDGGLRRGARASFARFRADATLLAALDAAPQVRLHGDLFLENLLWRPLRGASEDGQRLVLIDPVSVAGVVEGPPLFDLVKYESYAKGELLALRAEWVEVGGFDEGGDYRYRVRWDEPGLSLFRARDWQTRFRERYEAKYGPVDARVHRLLDGYFSLIMAVNTGGVQRRGRLLKAVLDFDAVADGRQSP